MSRHPRIAPALIVAAALALAGCRGAQTADPASARTAVAGNVPAPASSANGEHIATARYRIDIGYPALERNEAPLLAMLHRLAGAMKQDFLQALPDPEIFPELADRQLQLQIHFKVAARTSAFVSVRETGLQDTGGAHPAPIDMAIAYDAHAQRTVPLDDLFAKPDAARKTLADFARAELMKKMLAQAPGSNEGTPQAISEWKTNARQMVVQGTEPTPRNFANFVVRAGTQPNAPSPGLTLIFPPYQVAAYVYGTQVVDVPTRVFAAYLKPQYRDAFAMD
ncbi:MAG TPA: RsiV family protein [Rhodanobacteraceae bacterium]|nr:RsiV family protein [Rhodanobacteraceae bacterium]